MSEGQTRFPEDATHEQRCDGQGVSLGGKGKRFPAGAELAQALKAGDFVDDTWGVQVTGSVWAASTGHTAVWRTLFSLSTNKGE